MYTSYLRPWLRALHLPWSEEGGAGRHQPWSAAAHRRWLANAGPAAATPAVSELVPHLLTCFLTLERRVGQWHTLSSYSLAHTAGELRRSSGAVTSALTLSFRRSRLCKRALQAACWQVGLPFTHALCLPFRRVKDRLTAPQLTVSLSYQVSQARQEVESRSDATLLSVAGKALVTYRAADTILQASCLGPRSTLCVLFLTRTQLRAAILLTKLHISFWLLPAPSSLTFHSCLACLFRQSV